MRGHHVAEGRKLPLLRHDHDMEDIGLEGRAGGLGAVTTAAVVEGPNGKEYRSLTADEIAAPYLPRGGGLFESVGSKRRTPDVGVDFPDFPGGIGLLDALHGGHIGLLAVRLHNRRSHRRWRCCRTRASAVQIGLDGSLRA